MPFPFALPTTSSVSFSSSFSSTTHPSLPLTATTQRGVLRDVLKKHKRLAPQSRNANVSTVLSTLNHYLPYLLALDSGLSGTPVAGDEEVDVILACEPVFEWRNTLTSSPVPGREPPRAKLKSLEYEILFVLSVLAYTYTLLARAQLSVLFSSTTPTTEQRVAAVQTATRHLLQASSIHRYQVSRASQLDAPQQSSSPVDISVTVLNALSALALAEATLLVVLKDDPYPGIVSQDRNKDDREWMIKAPEIPRVRAHLFARFCLAASEHSAKASAILGGCGRGSTSNRVDETLVKYVETLRKTSRAKACRFLGIDADLGGKTGDAIAWLRAGKSELGMAVPSGVDDDSSKSSGLSKLKRQWNERKEDRKIEQGKEWGLDAGKLEEGRVLEMLEQKWVKINDTINTQLIPPWNPLLANLPSGRDIPNVGPFNPPHLDESTLAKMRAPPEPGVRGFEGDEDDSEDDESGRRTGSQANMPPGAFPGTGQGNASNSSYY
ncbi:MAG: hypothetical protein M4579_001459 [Chaenotheca gracillima]|nr:MAG: hypothetical protein M4579_001459 [Chaenotheca gracillima]